MKNNLIICLLAISVLSLSLVSAFDFPHTIVNIDYEGNLTNLSEMQDVNIPSPSNNQLLQYNSGTSKWIASTVSGLTDTNASTACSGTDYLAGNGSCLSAVGGGSGDITSVNTNGNYLTGGDTSGDINLLLNESELNNTIDARGGASYTNGTGLSLVGNTFSIVLSYFQGLFLELTDTFGGEVSGTYDNLVLDNNALDDQYVELTDLPLANLTTPYCGNITGATSNLCTIVGGNSSWNETYADTLYAPVNEPLWSGNSSSVARIGNCPSGQFVVNTTIGGVQCDAPAGSGDITAVNTNGKYLTGGAASGDVSLLLDESELNATIDLRDSDTTYTNGTGLSLTGNTFSIVLSYFQGLFLELTGGTLTGELNFSNAGIGNIDYIDFNTSTSSIHKEGRMQWNADQGLLEMDMANGLTSMLSSELLCPIVKNSEGSTMYRGEVIYAHGGQGDKITIKKAQSNNISKIRPIAVVKSESINNNADGVVTIFGIVSSFNTSMWNEGDFLYISPTVAGQLTNVRPSYPNLAHRVAWVTRSHATEGTIWIDSGIEYNTFNTTSVMFTNGNGEFSQDSGFTYNATTDNLNVDGNMSASYFIGDGSQLTGVSGGNSSWNETYADTLYRADSWNNLTGIPHATPTNGDTTHFSLADEIYDFVISLGYATTSYVDNLVSSVGNWTADKSSYSTKAVADTLYADISVVNTDTQDLSYDTGTDVISLVDGGSIDITEVNTDTQLTENQVEAFIFDNDNTDNLNMSGYNVTSIDYMKFEGGNSINDNSTCVIIEGSTSKMYIC